jgi:hypothetical protein
MAKARWCLFLCLGALSSLEIRGRHSSPVQRHNRQHTRARQEALLWEGQTASNALCVSPCPVRRRPVVLLPVVDVLLRDVAHQWVLCTQGVVYSVRGPNKTGGPQRGRVQAHTPSSNATT